MPPIINITSPTEGGVYDKDLQLIYSIADTDFASAWYAINNGTKIPINQSGTIPLTLTTDGQYKIVVGATDRRPQTAKDSVNFEIKTTGTGNQPAEDDVKIYPIPVSNCFNIEYKFNAEQQIHGELYDMNGRLLYSYKIEMTGTNIVSMDFSHYQRGIYFFYLTFGQEKKIYKLIKAE